MKQKQLSGRVVAFGRVKWKKYGDKKDQEGYVFNENNGFGWKVEKQFLDANGIVLDALLDCVKQLEEMKLDDKDVKKDHVPHAGLANTGVVIVSRKDPRVSCSVVLADDTVNEDLDLQLSWFFDVENDQGKMFQEPEMDVEKEEMKTPEIKEKEIEEDVDAFGIPKQMLTESRMKEVSYESILGLDEIEEASKEKEMSEDEMRAELKKLMFDIEAALDEKGIKVPGEGKYGDLELRIKRYEKGFSQDEDGKIVHYPTTLGFMIDARETYKFDLTADGRIIPEGKLLSGKGMSKQAVIDLIVKDVIDWNNHVSKIAAKK